MLTLKSFSKPKTACAILLSFLAFCAPADVYISEFMADNDEALLTAEGERSDWIELHNSGPAVIDISGWHLTDDHLVPAKWSFPANTLIAPDGYLLVFADGADEPLINGELHTNFKLSDSGEYLALIQSNGTTIACEFSPAYPKQYEDIGYGLTQIQTICINEKTPARYRIPDEAGTAIWHSATGGLGFTDSISTFKVNYYEMNSPITSVDLAESMVANPSYWSAATTYPLVEQRGVINMHANGGAGNFLNDEPFPNHAAIGIDKNWFVVVAETAIYIPAAGLWSFGVGSDDGFRLSISGQGQTFGTDFPGTRAFNTTVGSFNFATAGYYTLRLIFFENTGGATLELSCAQGSYSGFDATAFKLVGAPDAPVLMAADIGSFIKTDVRSEMLGTSSRLDAEWAFELPATIQPADTFTLALRYMDGCSIAVNGQPVTSFNTPVPLSWDSPSSGSRSLDEGAEPVEIAIPFSALSVGSNTLAITALNDSAADSDFIIQPVLTHTAANRYGRYFPVPTPGTANGKYYNAPTPKVTVSEPHGYKSAPFTAELICIDDPAAEMRYTLDGSVPDINSLVYTTPLTVNSTTILRTAVVDPESYEQRTESVTWLFIDEILTKDASTPAGWPDSGEINSHVMEYGMLQTTVNGDPDRLRKGMTNDIPSISIITDLDHLFSPQTGIYVNPRNDGTEWERPASVEMIDNARGREYEFQIDAGLRIRGAFSRNSDNPKHSFRLFFRSDYGEAKLKFKLFDDEGTDEYDNIDLRTAQNYSWSYSNDGRNTFAREVFARDTQRDMQMPYTRTRYYHLYLNGQYWGLYETQERGNANWAESYLGGKDEDYDCVKVSYPYVLATADGTFDAYFDLHNYAVNQGFAGAYSNNYWTIRGRDPDGTVNTNKPFYLNQDNLINYMLSCYITGDPDSPVTLGGTSVNNMYSLYNRINPAGFTWLRHDAEHSMGAYGDVNFDVTLRGSTLTAQDKFNPAILHIKLCEHPEYRMRFADLAYRHLFNDGALTPEKCLGRFQNRTAQIDSAIVAESARWGRGKTRAANWIPACNTVLNSYIPYRTEVVINQIKANGWYPQIKPPLLSSSSATVPEGYQLHINSQTTFYYTTDGTDPREANGVINPNAEIVILPPVDTAIMTLIEKGSSWRYYDAGTAPPLSGSLAWQSCAYPDSSWSSGPGILGFAGSAPQNTVATTTRRYLNGISGTQVNTTYFRRSFNLDTTNGVTSLIIELLRDDGAVIYINGVEVVRHNMPAGDITYATLSAAITGNENQTSYHPIEITDTSSLIAGENVIAVEVHQCNATSSDLYMDLSLTVNCSSICSETLSINEALTVKTRSFDGSEWSPLAEASFEITPPTPGIREPEGDGTDVRPHGSGRSRQ